MRIAQVMCNLECGGATAIVVPLSTKLAEFGHKVDVFYLDRPTASVHERLAIGNLDRCGVSCRSLGRKRGDPGVTAAAKLWWLAQRGGYEVMHSHLPLADAITGFVRHISPTRFKHVITVHNTVEPVSRIMAFCTGGANVVCCSEAARRRNPSGGPSNVVISNGIGLESYRNSRSTRIETRRSLSLPDFATVVIAVGRLCNQKNYECAIEGMAILKRQTPDIDIRFLICGDGPDKESLKTLTTELQLDGCIYFCNNRTDIPELLAASDIFLSTSSHEGMPLAVLEALTAGLPCVLSAIDEHYEIARNLPGCAFLCPNSPEEVSRVLQALIKHRMSPSVLRCSREPLLEKFSIEACVGSYSDFYQSLQQI
jgi:glycosyltransferase involved in cell wall biosynthesis